MEFKTFEKCQNFSIYQASKICTPTFTNRGELNFFETIGFANPDLRVDKAGLVNHNLKLIHGLGFANPDL
jgi:hypothetical protein